MMDKQQSRSTSSLSRRTFMTQAASAAAGAALVTSSSVARAADKPVSANDRIGVGVIGNGGRGNAHLHALNWLQDHGEVEIVALSDTYRPRMRSTGERYGVPESNQYMDYRDLLQHPKVDMVTIATPDHHHGYAALAAVKAGKSVYCEKPVTHWRQFDLTKQLAAAVKESGCTFQLGSQGMSDTAWHQMRELVQGGLIGQPIHAECGYFRVGDWGERGMPIDDPNAQPGSDLDWDAFLGDSPKRDFDVSRYFRWRMYEDYAGGPVTDLFPHSLTPVLSILGVGMPSMVVATGGMFRYQEREVPDTFNMLIDYPEKITVAVLGTQGNNEPATGARGAGQRIPVIRGWEGSLTIRGTRTIVFTPAEGSDKKPQEFKIEQGEDFVGHFQNLLDCHRAGSQDTNSPMDLAFRVQTPIQMAYLALRDKKVAQFDTDKQEIVL
ncbi:MAG: Gfo/Idh/MocA family oxidoreductase [Nitrospiraceae bacterium]|nr:Gfo/Idh/MocA family oxidoreductase [Nitrospiraceae bacterium]